MPGTPRMATAFLSKEELKKNYYEDIIPAYIPHMLIKSDNVLFQKW